MVDYPLVFPVIGDVTYADWFYASRASGEHHAQDLMGTKMLPIVAAASGRIEYVNWSSNPDDLRPEKCCTIVLRHDDGWQTYYLHLNNDSPGTDDGQGWGVAPGIRPGVHVQAGELIGWMGDSGNAEGTSPHLHFELRDPSGIIVNPYEALRAAEGKEPPATCSGGSDAPLDALLGGTRLLRKGTSGADVGELQGFLNLQGHEAGPVDRIFGSMTDLAVRAFQRDRGLNADGVVGAQTRTAVRSIATGSGFASLTDPNGRILRPHEARGEDVRLLQEWMRVLGYDAGPFDGVYGERTAAAVSAFQTAAGLRADGKVGPATREALAKALGIIAAPSCGA
jgi:peptidoglycan hydrolase-like protein with peptidoglycan-binding domain